jgi:hypothetical protein
LLPITRRRLLAVSRLLLSIRRLLPIARLAIPRLTLTISARLAIRRLRVGIVGAGLPVRAVGVATSIARRREDGRGTEDDHERTARREARGHEPNHASQSPK